MKIILQLNEFVIAFYVFDRYNLEGFKGPKNDFTRYDLYNKNSLA